MAREVTTLETIDQLISDGAKAAAARHSTAQQNSGPFNSQSEADILADAGLSGPTVPSATDKVLQESSYTRNSEISLSAALANKQGVNGANDPQSLRDMKTLKVVPSIKDTPPKEEARMPSIDMGYNKVPAREQQIKKEYVSLHPERFPSVQPDPNLAYGTASVINGHTQSPRRLPDRPLAERISSGNSNVKSHRHRCTL